MTQIVLNIRNKRDIPFLKRLSKSMGWTIAGDEQPNETTIAAMREVKSGADLETLDVDHFMDFVASL